MTTLLKDARPNIQAFLDFDEGSLFGPEDSERIVSTSKLDALEEMLDGSILPDTEDVEAWLKTQTEFWTIAAYKQETVSRGDIDQWAEWHAEHLREAFGEDYGDEDGDDRLSDADIAELSRRTKELAEWYVSRVHVWRCAHLRTFTFDSADMLQLVQELRPDWLNKNRAPNV